MSMDRDIAQLLGCVERLEQSLDGAGKRVKRLEHTLDGAAVFFGRMFVCNLVLLALILWRVW